MMYHQGKTWQKTYMRPRIDSFCLISEDGDSRIVKVIGHSTFDEDSYFFDSARYRGVMSINNVTSTTHIAIED